MNYFPYKETHFFDFIQFPSFVAQLCNLVAHPVGPLNQENWAGAYKSVGFFCSNIVCLIQLSDATKELAK